MQAIAETTRGLALLVSINWDRILYLGTVLAALGWGAWLGDYFMS